MHIFRQLLLTALGLLALQHTTQASTITFALPGASYSTMNSYTELGFSQAGGQGTTGFWRTAIDFSPAFMIFSSTATVTSLWAAALRGRSSHSARLEFKTLTATSTNLAFVPFGPQDPPSFNFQDHGVVNPSNGTAFPEPTAMLLLGTGLAGVAAKVRRLGTPRTERPEA